MSDGGAPGGRAPRPRRSIGLRVSGLLSLALFFVPLVAPFIQVVTLALVAAAVRRRAIDALSLAIGAGGSLLGLVLHLLAQYVWIV
jgi:hypothetical protein